ncbi:extracellular calcium-sensing receptor-like [Oryzias latipes]|uniref:extracellular calcium-sensing receptor-like n=1 Tax=Oryzias latipes TaxID=8090 RepID=UPI0009D96C00|nr:extracellular calcium-sensing receptor-like [Oryzias latipes]
MENRPLVFKTSCLLHVFVGSVFVTGLVGCSNSIKELQTLIIRETAETRQEVIHFRVAGVGVDSDASQCVTLGDSHPVVLQSEGDVIVGGLFPLHYEASEPEHTYHSKPPTTPCTGFDQRAFRWLMTMVFAVEEINHSSVLLPGVTLGYRITDSCDNVHNSLRALFPLISSSIPLTNQLRKREATENTSTIFFERVQSVEVTTAKAGNVTTYSKEQEFRTTWSETNACLSGSPVSAVIGLASSSPTRAVAQALGPFSIPLVSYFATCTCLTDKRMYPSFLRTVPSDIFQVRGLVQLVTFLGWRWVGTIGTTDDYSQYGIQSFSAQFQKQGGCVAFHLTIPKSPTLAEIQEMADRVQRSAARVVVVFATEGQLLDLYFELVQRNVTHLQWVASEAWVTAALLTLPHFHSLLEGTLGFSFPGVNIPSLENFLLNIHPSAEPGMEFINMFWEDQFGCKLHFEEDGSIKNVGDVNLRGLNAFGSNPEIQNASSAEQESFFNRDSFAETPFCTGFENLSLTGSSYTDVSRVRISYNVYKAVYAIAHALHALLNCDSAEQNEKSCDKHKQFTSEQLLSHLKLVNFTNKFGEKVCFDSNGEPVPLYDIINWQKDKHGKMRFVTVGSYDGSVPLGRQLQLNQSNIIWTEGHTEVPVSLCSEPCPPGNRQARRKGEPQCCFDCFPCADGEISNETGSAECIKCPESYWSDEKKVKCVAGIEEFLSFKDSMGIILVALTLLGVVLTAVIIVIFHRFRTTPIVKANNSEISFLLLLSLKLCFLCSLVFIGQPSVWTCRIRQTAFGISFVICLSCLLVKTIVVLLAFQTKLPGSRALKLFGPSQQRIMIVFTTAPQVCLCAGWLLWAPPFPFRNSAYQASTRKIVVECKEPWPPGFCLVLGYIGLIASVCLLLAFLGRKLPDTFNEARLITFSMLIFSAVWISFIPAYISSPGKFSVVVEIFAILASSFGLLLCIFGPKCYIILLHPERNIKKCVRSKNSR